MSALRTRLRAAVAQRLVRGPGPLQRLRAQGVAPLLGRPPTLELYYEAGDPHSHLAAQCLPQLADRLRLPLVVRVVGEPEAELYPEADKQRGFALTDAARIAPAYGLDFPEAAVTPTQQARFEAARLLAGIAEPRAFAEREAVVADALFRGQPLPTGERLGEAETQRLLAANVQRRVRLGHYLPGMWQLAGDWFWGVDRMAHLEAALRARDALEGEAPLLGFDAAKARLPSPPQGEVPIEFFFSFRSPYSYLAVEALREALPRLGAPVAVRPVLPMAMRGMKVPARKRLYIVRDVKRESERLGLPFGRIADPIGAGAERCLSVFQLAEGVEQQLDFLVSASRAVWAEAIDVATDDGMRKVCERAGISWSQAADKLAAGMDLEAAEINRSALFEAGLWGVPSYRWGDFSTWGRDRFWMIEALAQPRI